MLADLQRARHRYLLPAARNRRLHSPWGAANRAGAFKSRRLALCGVGGRSAGKPCTHRGQLASGRGVVAGEKMIEQINNTPATALYLHHDQQGSTRLLTGTTGHRRRQVYLQRLRVPSCEGTATTPLGYDAQYTNSDTGLIYLRARVYDPATAQFLSVDPLGRHGRPLLLRGRQPAQ